MRIAIVALFLIISIAVFLFLTNKDNSPEAMAQKIVDAAIQAHGSDKLNKSVVKLDFRDRSYRATRDGGRYIYERMLEDSVGMTHDSLSNDGFTRRINGALIDVTAEKADSYSNSVNSVIYFALLPYFLNDPAAIKTYLGEANIKGAPYNKIKVTFQQEGGGKDFQDQFIYWFHKDRNTLDYLAYNYETDGGGSRFRVAYNVREVNGIRFADYINMKPQEKSNLDVETFDELYNQDKLIEVSRIDSENVEVKLR